MTKNIIPFLILGVAGLAIAYVVYNMLKSKDQHHRPDMTHVPVHSPMHMPKIHGSDRVVGSVGTVSSSMHRALYSNQYGSGSY
jgi:hypothetical protein